VRGGVRGPGWGESDWRKEAREEMVGDSKKCSRGTFEPRASSTRASMRTEEREEPPSWKKLS
jgi:hypothetical protein